ncbi:hypothetical protein SPRG_00018 [Saprolegnia parasitica CBS 223.65]|uniref:EGF-like domain-containing protein n=1 Tax=Saprolegnia parasitica (strain CBS 223.65) TaxID=695850 RepID=A0A067D865_SAPPC|nr:hypothetical protein SPRG_00018 [Saprolegnia parasitica CBS 223.65]KDO35172.1 hypothetical protein SPRG_00018 [Saprolegnia parasitica CBS 223.65]|eukprot:XP_012193524.1 hypothetical protein SPRG_00018 [Saprolegnia parasitica CBS 223.65]
MPRPILWSLLVVLLVATVAAESPVTPAPSACKACAASGQCDRAYNASAGKFCGLIPAPDQYCCCSTEHMCPPVGSSACTCAPGPAPDSSFTKTRQVFVLIFLGFLLFGCILLCERLGLPPSGRRQGYVSIESAHYPG